MIIISFVMTKFAEEYRAKLETKKRQLFSQPM